MGGNHFSMGGNCFSMGGNRFSVWSVGCGFGVCAFGRGFMGVFTGCLTVSFIYYVYKTLSVWSFLSMVAVVWLVVLGGLLLLFVLFL